VGARRPGQVDGWVPAATDELLARLRAHTRRRLDDDVAVLLAELTLTDPAVQPTAPGPRPAAGAAVGAPSFLSHSRNQVS
jgi:DNA-binding response OmpR family regulator